MGEGRYLQVLSGEGKRLIQVEKFYLSGVLDLGEVNIFDRGERSGGCGVPYQWDPTHYFSCKNYQPERHPIAIIQPKLPERIMNIVAAAL